MPLVTSPWTIVASREVYANPWITVVEHDVIRPDGKPGLYGIVQSSLAVGVVPLTDEGNVVLVGQWRVPFDEWSWEIPEGGTGPDEDGLTAIKRELQEETGYVAREWELFGPTIQLSNSHSSEEADVYVARGLTQVGANPDGDEVLEVIEVPFETALDMVDRGEITDSITVIALLRLARQRGA
ncbi:ADP-ribose pyrophosphatase [Euzebya pacifica]|uniref:ADP-ribose pyrophosphatase n=1 Tax=Euzebya pacifica TaxID=1608957 RepID=A0A346Y288_9ACTN|nr:NUDIX hydrolase [Euzebya pacifica]AXV08585.1 ADP-ribose pyrophosphatase [Euzebya pacifica]